MRQIRWGILAAGLLLLCSCGSPSGISGTHEPLETAPAASLPAATAPTPTATPTPTQAEPVPTPVSDQDIGAERAKEIALAHAGLEAGQVTFLETKQDWEVGQRIYDVEFYDGAAVEYDYEISAADGSILSMDQDAERRDVHPAAGTQAVMLSLDQAIEIALEQVPGAGRDHVTKCELDWDDGQQVYEGEIHYQYTEYEFEMDANTGTILKWESDRD